MFLSNYTTCILQRIPTPSSQPLHRSVDTTPSQEAIDQLHADVSEFLSSLFSFLEVKLDQSEAGEIVLVSDALAQNVLARVTDTLAAFANDDLDDTPLASVKYDLTEVQASTLWQYCVEVLSLVVEVPNTDEADNMTEEEQVELQ